MRFSIEKIVTTLIENGKCKEEEKELVVYGLKTGVEMFFNIITTIIIALLFGMVMETLVFSISFFFLRSYCGGVHARNGVECYFFSVAMLVTVLLVQKFDLVSLNFIYTSLVLGMIIILLIAPLGNKNKPLDDLEKKVYGNKVRFILLIHILLFFVFKMLAQERVIVNISLSIVVVSISLIFGKIKNKFDDKNEF